MIRADALDQWDRAEVSRKTGARGRYATENVELLGRSALEPGSTPQHAPRRAVRWIAPRRLRCEPSISSPDGVRKTRTWVCPAFVPGVGDWRPSELVRAPRRHEGEIEEM